MILVHFCAAIHLDPSDIFDRLPAPLANGKQAAGLGLNSGFHAVPFSCLNSKYASWISWNFSTSPVSGLSG